MNETAPARGGLTLRLAFLALLAGGLVLWTQLRKPRDLRLEVDLTQVLPGDVTSVDVVVERDGHLLARHQESYGRAGAPGLLRLEVHARPGDAEVDATLVYADARARRTREAVRLTQDVPARVVVR